MLRGKLLSWNLSFSADPVPRTKQHRWYFRSKSGAVPCRAEPGRHCIIVLIQL